VSAIRPLLVVLALVFSALSIATPATHAASLNQAKPTIRRGNTGAFVREAQSRVNIWIARAKPAGMTQLPVTGSFGPMTEAAVKAFQRSVGLPVVGFVGPQTWAKLPALTGTPARSAPRASAPPARSGNCDPSYPDVCIAPYSQAGDLDCGEVPFRRFRVIGRDPHRFDGDNDGIGCER
jgi:hypothetical protein